MPHFGTDLLNSSFREYTPAPIFAATKTSSPLDKTSNNCIQNFLNSICSMLSFCYAVDQIAAQIHHHARRLSENSDRSEGEAGSAGFFDYLSRIVALFNEKNRKIRPGRFT